MMKTWEDLDSSSSEEEIDEEANICLIAEAESASDFEDEHTEVQETDFEILENAYNELLHDSGMISKAYKKQKKRIFEFIKENISLKEQNEILKKMASSNTIFEHNTSDEVNKLNKDIEMLKQDLSKFVQGTENLDRILKYSRIKNDRSGLGYIEKDIANSSSIPSCNNCGKAGHITSKYIHLH
ncbi:hypothetical protein Fmac_032748 [Flemingia macrophylla]|uniref:CCHC-type domain-containing protein n=1 Tax=Flemingia macrophylla TaxID=520843 RepID=A0ABD1L5T6_9FABA